jgi:hypothetical protein
VRLITGASGGMVGAAYYVATLHPPATADRLGDYLARPGGPTNKYRHSRTDVENNTIALRPDEIVDGVMQDGLSTVVHRGIYGDFPALFWYSPRVDDRGRALESAWSGNLHRALDVPFQALRDGETAGWRPSLVFSPMLVEDGRRLLISNLDLEQVAQAQGNALLGGTATGRSLKEGRVFSRSAIELFRAFGNRPDFRLRTAARTATPRQSPEARKSRRRDFQTTAVLRGHRVRNACALLTRGGPRGILRRKPARDRHDARRIIDPLTVRTHSLPRPLRLDRPPDRPRFPQCLLQLFVKEFDDATRFRIPRRLHPHRASRRDRHYRDPDRPLASRHSKGPGGRGAHDLFEQPQTVGAGAAQSA